MSWKLLQTDRIRRPFAAWLELHPWLHGFAMAIVTAVVLTLVQHVFDRIVPTVNNGWAIYWPFNGILVAVLLMCRRSYWPWIMAGFFCAFIRIQINGADPPAEMGIIVLCNGAEVLLAALLLPPFHSLKRWLLEPRLNTRFVLYAVLLGPVLTSFPVGYYFASRYPGQFWNNAIWWGFSDALGAALWTPLVLVLFSRETYDLFRWRALPQTLALLLALCALT